MSIWVSNWPAQSQHFSHKKCFRTYLTSEEKQAKWKSKNIPYLVFFIKFNLVAYRQFWSFRADFFVTWFLIPMYSWGFLAFSNRWNLIFKLRTRSLPGFVGRSVCLSQFSTSSVEYFSICHSFLHKVLTISVGVLEALFDLRSPWKVWKSKG